MPMLPDPSLQIGDPGKDKRIYLTQEWCDRMHTPLAVGQILKITGHPSGTVHIFKVKSYDPALERFLLEWPD